MNENATIGSAKNASVPLAENEHVKDLIAILAENGKDTSGLTAILNHCTGMENFCKQAESKIEVMKCQLDEMKEMQNHPIKTALQNTIKSLEAKVAEIKGMITSLKANVIDGCKNAVAAFRDKGVIALDKLASFFRIKGGLEGIKKHAIAVSKDCDKTLAKIESFSNEYHKAGRALKNMARFAVGKQPIDEVKEAGKLAKAVGEPYRTHKACMNGIRKMADKAIEKIDSLSKSSEVKREESVAAKKPPLMVRLKEKKELIRQKDLEKAVPERTIKPRGLEV